MWACFWSSENMNTKIWTRISLSWMWPWSCLWCGVCVSRISSLLLWRPFGCLYLDTRGRAQDKMLQNLKHLFQELLADKGTCSLPSPQESCLAVLCVRYSRSVLAKLLINPGRAIVARWWFIVCVWGEGGRFWARQKDRCHWTAGLIYAALSWYCQKGRLLRPLSYNLKQQTEGEESAKNKHKKLSNRCCKVKWIGKV